MGMNAYFTYSVVGFRGTGDVAWNSAVTAVIIEGAIFFVLAASGIRTFLVRLIPEPVRLATPAAIGAFLAHLGLQTAEGIGVVVSDIATAVTLGACPLDKRTPIVAFTEQCQENPINCVVSEAYTCDDLGGVMTSPTTWMGILGMMLTLILMAYKWRSAMILGIGFVTIVSWFRNTAVTYFPNTPAGDARFDYFSQVVNFENMNMILVPFTSDLKSAGVALITFLYVDFLDTSGTLMGIVSNMGKFAALILTNHAENSTATYNNENALSFCVGYTDENGDFPRSRQAFCVDAISTMFGSLFGMSPITSYVESAGGVGAGARTGLTALFVGFFFFLSLFFAPIIASIPPWATGGALILVGSMMARSLKDVKWDDITHAATAFVTVIVMPLTYSIANGLIAGICMWIILQVTFFILGFVGIERPELTEDEVPSGGLDKTEVNEKELDSNENSSEEQQAEEAPAQDIPDVPSEGDKEVDKLEA